MNKIEIEIGDYLSEDEMKEIAKDELKEMFRTQFNTRDNIELILSNTAYGIEKEEINKIIPNYKSILDENVKKVLQNPNNYTFCIFNDGDTYSKEGLGHKYLIEAIENNKQVIQDNVIKNIKERDYSDDVTNSIENVVDKITSNMDYLVGLLKQNK